MLGTLTTLAAIAWNYLFGQLNSGYQPPSQPPRGTSGDGASPMAVATLVCGLATWTVLPLIAGFVGIVLGWIELDRIKKGQSPEEGKTITQVGFYLSIASVLIKGVGGCLLAAINFAAIAAVWAFIAGLIGLSAATGG